MSYYVFQRDSSFFIPKEQMLAAFQAVIILGERLGDDYLVVHAPVDIEQLAKAKTLSELLLAWGWNSEQDEVGNIVDIQFERQSLGDDDYLDDCLFSALSPFVRSGSFIEMNGEDGYIWRWHFHDKKCYDEGATITYGCSYEE